MVRSSAKNYNGVAIVTDPDDYAPLLAEMKANGGALQLGTRFNLAKKAFTHTARLRQHDRQLADRPGRRCRSQAGRSRAGPAPIFPAKLQLAFDRTEILRYGENSHQQAAFYRDTDAAGRQHRRLHPAAGQGTVLQQHRRLRRGLGMRQGLRRCRPA